MCEILAFIDIKLIHVIKSIICLEICVFFFCQKSCELKLREFKSLRYNRKLLKIILVFLVTTINITQIIVFKLIVLHYKNQLLFLCPLIVLLNFTEFLMSNTYLIAIMSCINTVLHENNYTEVKN